MNYNLLEKLVSICYLVYEQIEFYNVESPFEFRALEVALEAICSFLAARTTELETAAYPALDELTSKVRFPCYFFFLKPNGKMSWLHLFSLHSVMH